MIGEKQLQHGHIPADIVEEILLKLPAKSLIRFRSVSTSWQSLISSRKFIIKHHKIAESKLLQSTLIYHQLLNSLPFYLPDSPNLNFHPSATKIIGPPPSCHGLICVRNNDNESVWNPSTRTIKHIPNSSSGICFGIGHDADRDDYKIVKLSSGWPSKTTKTEIYSLETGSWTTTDDFPADICEMEMVGDRCESVYLDGAIHWLATHKRSIFSFDLSTNKYKRIPLPEYELKHYKSRQVRLAAFRGMLYVLVNDKSGLILWGLKEGYRDWIRHLQIPWRVFGDEPQIPWTVFGDEPHGPFFKLFYVYENGEFLIGEARERWR